MTREHFQTQLNRLVARFPGKVYGAEFATLLWRECGSLSDEWLTHAVDEFIGSCRQPPLMPEFREVISRERERSWNKQKRVAPGINWNRFAACDTCWDNGVYLCVRNGEESAGFYAFRCHCHKGASDPRTGIPQFKADHAKEFVWFDARRLSQFTMQSSK